VNCPSSVSTSPLGPQPLEPVRQLRAAFAIVRELPDEQRERLSVTGDSEGTDVHRIQPHVADQRRVVGVGDLLARIARIPANENASTCSAAASTSTFHGSLVIAARSGSGISRIRA
jgi:hypothetical protein